ncbi:hypothetical protein Afil01_42240 [Actinorhabdospora filicis]|uniref:Uncharacterized protein n=1 Tax=Actinorhabdospora filicis TaxID=1785913 RepID=A0A9W6W4M3_9ACTN|nr:hypothetical protein Afil01_42240 [Actinorhabdospora filicis]
MPGQDHHGAGQARAESADEVMMKRPALYGALLAFVVLALFAIGGGLGSTGGDGPQNDPVPTVIDGDD